MLFPGSTYFLLTLELLTSDPKRRDLSPDCRLLPFGLR